MGKPPILPTWHCPPGGHGGADVVKALGRNGKGLGVQVFLKTPVTKILKDKKGSVAGVVAQTKEGNRGGSPCAIKARSVIIATGGHGSNRELLKKYHPSYSEDVVYTGARSAGDGVALAAGVGADTDTPATLLYHAPLLPLSTRRPVGAHLRAIIRQPNTVWVNKRGERFVDENSPYTPVETANAVGRQPNKTSYTLLDEEIKQRAMRQGFTRAAGQSIRAGMRSDELDEHLHSQVETGLVRIADSWDEIARWIGAEPALLASTIDRYNRFCDLGYDDDFLKDPAHLQPLRTPPYYAVKCIQAFLDTIGGIKINHRMEVLDRGDKAIPGLYAAGVTTSGWMSGTYCIKLAGSAFGFAINSGRIAGENAAAYAGSAVKAPAPNRGRRTRP